DWSPASSSHNASSTVDPRSAAPGWQGNNDLNLVTLGESGRAVRQRGVLPPNAGGQYGWWGTMFAWAGDGTTLAYSRPDSVGIVDLNRPEFTAWAEFVPYQTRGDWAWLPGVAWGEDGGALFLVDHGAPIGLEGAAASPVFDLVARTGPGGRTLTLTPRAGMFAGPSVSPAHDLPSGERAYAVAFLQALTPLESEESGHALMVIDRDGSNRRRLFPPEGEPGLKAQQPVWAPSGDRLALIHRGDLWIVDLASGIGQRLTGDGLTTVCDWGP
ncbi:MAG: TolB family protein, partial [Anaerolineales bacterium]